MTRQTALADAVTAASSRSDLDVVIVSYRSRDLVLRCLESLEAAAGNLTTTVVVADNHSGDGTVDALRGRYAHVDAFDTGSNLGFATANNRGIARGSGTYVLVLNPDTVVGPDTLMKLVDAAESLASTGEPVGVVAPRMVNRDGSPQRTARAFPTPAAAVFGRRSPLTRWFPHNRFSAAFLLEDVAGGRADGAPFPVDWVSGAAMLLPRSVIESVGGFDEEFFLYWEDADLCRRIRSAGHSVWCVPAAVVVHDEGGSRDHAWPPQSIVRFHLGAYRYWTKHHAPAPYNPARWLGALALLARAGVLVITHQSRTALRALRERRSPS